MALSKIKEALHAAREAMKGMPQSAKALKLVGDVHASNSSGREKVKSLKFPLELGRIGEIFLVTAPIDCLYFLSVFEMYEIAFNILGSCDVWCV